MELKLQGERTKKTEIGRRKLKVLECKEYGIKIKSEASIYTKCKKQNSNY